MTNPLSRLVGTPQQPTAARDVPRPEPEPFAPWTDAGPAAPVDADGHSTDRATRVEGRRALAKLLREQQEERAVALAEDRRLNPHLYGINYSAGAGR